MQRKVNKEEAYIFAQTCFVKFCLQIMINIHKMVVFKI